MLRWDKEELVYLIDKKAAPVELAADAGKGGAHFSARPAARLARDAGHEGKRLKDFCQSAEAQAAGLSEAEVLALRLATGRCGLVLEDAMRAGGAELEAPSNAPPPATPPVPCNYCPVLLPLTLAAKHGPSALCRRGARRSTFSSRPSTRCAGHAARTPR